MVKELFERIKDALQSPPGKFLLALGGGLALGCLAYKAGRKSGITRVATGTHAFDSSDTRTEIDRIQHENAESLAESFRVIDSIIADIRRGNDGRAVRNPPGGGGES